VNTKLNSAAEFDEKDKQLDDKINRIIAEMGLK
jgi:hypothetical protein